MQIPLDVVRCHVTDAFHAARRRLQDLERKMRGEVKTPAPSSAGGIAREEYR
jgi:hypothetical protein